MSKPLLIARLRALHKTSYCETCDSIVLDWTPHWQASRETHHGMSVLYALDLPPRDPRGDKAFRAIAAWLTGKAAVRARRQARGA